MYGKVPPQAPDLEEAVLELFVDYWAAAGAGVRDGPVGPAVTTRLHGLLRDGFGLETFQPASIYDHPPDWLTVRPGGRATTGLVRRVHRPGLRDTDGHLRIPAIVEVD